MPTETKQHLKRLVDYLDKEPIWMLVLFPGFLSYIVARFISDFEQLNTLEQIFTILGFSITNSVLTIFTCNIKDLIKAKVRKKFRKSERTQRVYLSTPFFLFCILIYSITVGFTTGLVIQKNVVNNYLYQKGILPTPSKKSEVRPLTKLLFLNSRGKIADGRGWKVKGRKAAWVRVHLKDGQIIEGWPKFYSLTEKPGELYLSPACIIMSVEKDLFQFHKGPGILIYENEIKYIDFVDDNHSMCFKQNELYFECMEKEKKVINQSEKSK